MSWKLATRHHHRHNLTAELGHGIVHACAHVPMLWWYVTMRTLHRLWTAGSWHRSSARHLLKHLLLLLLLEDLLLLLLLLTVAWPWHGHPEALRARLLTHALGLSHANAHLLLRLVHRWWLLLMLLLMLHLLPWHRLLMLHLLKHLLLNLLLQLLKTWHWCASRGQRP